MKEEIEFLKRRASEFWEKAGEDFQKGRYNLAALDAEQAVQLWLKYLIALKSADFPKAHYLDILIKEIINLYESESLANFYKSNILQFKSLEDAYLTTRYFPKEFSEEEARSFIDFGIKIFAALENATREKLI